MGAPLPMRVGQLVRLLSSDKAGEVVAAAAALNRTLAGVGLDIHDLAAVVEAGLGVPLVPDDSGEDWRSIARFCRRRPDRLAEKEAGFVETILQYRAPPTERQLKWLHDIYGRLKAESQARGRA